MSARSAIRRLLPLSALLMMLCSAGCVSVGPIHAGQWFRGNTHAHTTRSDGDAAPEVVAKWYLDHDYNFLIITDHNKLVAPGEVKLPEDRRKDFLLIPGDEVSGARKIHTTAMNIKELVPWQFQSPDRAKIAQSHVDGTLQAGGIPILNHPNFFYAISAEDILRVRNLELFELANGHPIVNNGGDETHPSTEVMWDWLLTHGMKIYAVASDDAHKYHEFSAEHANPGRGWVMVRAAQLDADAIMRAMERGDFYASSGVFLVTCERGAGVYAVEVDAARTKHELASLPSPGGKHVENAEEGFRIEFIGPDGGVLKTVNGEKGRFEISGSIPYVRARVTYTRKRSQQHGFEEYYAWGQPVFADDRADITTSERDKHNNGN